MSTSSKCFIIFGEWHNNILAAITADTNSQALVLFYKKSEQKIPFELFEDSHKAIETIIFPVGTQNFNAAEVKDIWLNRIVPEKWEETTDSK